MDHTFQRNIITSEPIEDASMEENIQHVEEVTFTESNPEMEIKPNYVPEMNNDRDWQNENGRYALTDVDMESYPGTESKKDGQIKNRQCESKDEGMELVMMPNCCEGFAPDPKETARMKNVEVQKPDHETCGRFCKTGVRVDCETRIVRACKTDSNSARRTNIATDNETNNFDNENETSKTENIGMNMDKISSLGAGASLQLTRSTRDAEVEDLEPGKSEAMSCTSTSSMTLMTSSLSLDVSETYDLDDVSDDSLLTQPTPSPSLSLSLPSEVYDLADVNDNSVMTHPTSSPSLSFPCDNVTEDDTTPQPFVTDQIVNHNNDNSTLQQSSVSQSLQLPDIIASLGIELSTLIPRSNFFCASAVSNNYIELCPSSENGHCQKRSALIFPDMVADVGGCLCSRGDLRERLPAGWPDVFDPLPDLVVSHGCPEAERSSKPEMMTGKTILVTGGAGYIGSHAVIELVEAGYDVVVVDNLVNASMESIRRVEKIVGKKVTSYSIDLLKKPALDEVFQKHSVYAVIHFAGLKAVGESCELPLLYYKTNVGGTTNLLEVMEAHKVYNMVFSSSATVYGTPQFLPLTETHPVGGCTNPYGKTKFMIEQMLNDLTASKKIWNIVILRYFNPVGAHISGTIGEDPLGVPNNLMPFIGQVAVGRRSALKVYGTDYDTHDGTGVRDYIHVVDLAQGHLAALRKLEEQCGLKVYNLGTGRGCSVLDMVKAFEKASGKKIPYELEARRSGDVPSMYGDTSLAAKELGWTAKKGLDEMCADLWRWQSQNPQGYNTDTTGQEQQ